MKIAALLISISLTSVWAAQAAQRAKRAAYDLPDALGLLQAPLRTTFVCQKDGYYADQDNNCQIFHVCHTVTYPYGRTEILQYSFICGNLTIFNQHSFTCTYPKDAVPCDRAHEYYHLNDLIGDPNAAFQGGQGTGGLGGSGRGGGSVAGGIGASRQGGGTGGGRTGGGSGIGGHGDSRVGGGLIDPRQAGVRGSVGSGGLGQNGGTGLHGRGPNSGYDVNQDDDLALITGGELTGGVDRGSISLTRLRQAVKRRIESAIKENTKDFINLEKQIDEYIKTDNRPELRKLLTKVITHKGKIEDLSNQIESLGWEDSEVKTLRKGVKDLDDRAEELISKINNHLNKPVNG